MSDELAPNAWLDRIKAKGPWALAVWAVGLLSWLLLLIFTDGHLLAISAWSVPFLLMIAAVSTPWRSVSWSSLLGLFLVGMGPVFLVVLGIQWLIGVSPVEDWTRDLLAALADAGFEARITFPKQVIWAPVLEELLKVTPLLILVRWKASGLRTLAGPIDYAVMAGATGAGFSFAEDITVYLGQGRLLGPPSSVFGLNLGPLYRDLVGARPGRPFGGSAFADNMSFLFPEMQHIYDVIWIGHGALALALGLAIGLTVWGVRRLRTRLLWLIPIWIYLWVVWEHMMANWYAGAACGLVDRGLPLCKLAHLDLRGRIFPFVVLAGLGLAIYLSREAIRYYRDVDSGLAVEGFSRDGYRSDGWRGTIAYVRDWFDFRRWRRKASYGAEYLRRRQTASRRDVLAMTASRLRALTIRGRLTGEESDPAALDVGHMIHQVVRID